MLQFLTFTLLFIWLQVTLTNSRTSTLLRLNPAQNKIVDSTLDTNVHQGINQPAIIDGDSIFNIIVSTVRLGNLWTKGGVDYYCTNCRNLRVNSVNR